MPEISIQSVDFDAGLEIKCLREASAETGAVATFTGIVSDINEGSPVSTLELEHYPGMTEKSIAAIIDEAKNRWPLLAVRVIHRIGKLAVREQIVFVGVSSRHRGAAFAACEFIMDFLKTRAPFWKKETIDGGSRWVDARVGDDAAAARWK
ncbi:MAG: molybdopterin synthase catalytic subunit MoaE [Verrucomicrobiaceae bacterium]|nr:molybdopterin synthase catalytic subunit MoaE [Verrucomicrobiaceae bacterium]